MIVQKCCGGLFDILISYPIREPVKLKNDDFSIFCHSKQIWQANKRQRIKIKEIAAQHLQKSLSKVSTTKMRILAQSMRPLNFLYPKSNLKISKCIEIPMNLAIRYPEKLP